MEYLSVCCYAVPLYDLCIEEGLEPIGICVHCRDFCSFEEVEDDNVT